MSEMTVDEAKEFWNRYGGPAFPLGSPISSQHGMTLRDYFAAHVLNGLLSGGDIDLTAEKSSREVTRASYALADAMLREREVGRD